jgi:glycerol-3-phosphate dehydrogenase (NAD(P)+)
MTPPMQEDAVAIIGGGPWGLALAAGLARSGRTTLLHSRRQLDGLLPRGVTLAKSHAEIGERARLIVLAVPSNIVRDVARSIGDHIDGRHFLVHGIRGLVGEAMSPVSEILRAETPARRIGALGGPVLADDLTAGRPSVLVCGSAFPEVCRAVDAAISCPQVRVYTTDDLRGLEWASALVGCLAVGVGYAAAVGFGAGLLAAFISRGVQEAGRLAAAAGGEERTLLGLAGYGDLLASVEQKERPEVMIGRSLAKGRTLAQALDDAKLRVEAVELIPRVAAWAQRTGVSAPIFHALAHGVLAAKPVDAIVNELMTAPIESRG